MYLSGKAGGTGDGTAVTEREARKRRQLPPVIENTAFRDYDFRSYLMNQPMTFLEYMHWQGRWNR